MRYMWTMRYRLVWLSKAYLPLAAGRGQIQAQRALEFSRAHQELRPEAYALRLLGEVAAQRHRRKTSKPQPTTSSPRSG